MKVINKSKLFDYLGKFDTFKTAIRKIPLLGQVFLQKDEFEQQRNELYQKNTEIEVQHSQLKNEMEQLKNEFEQLKNDFEKLKNNNEKIIEQRDNLQIEKHNLIELVRYKDISFENIKALYASPVGKDGKEFLKKIIERFGYKDFDYLIFIYDDTEFNEPIFKDCKFIREKGTRWYFIRKYVTPENCKNYDYIFLWPDDIDIDNFSYKNFLIIMNRNYLEMAQPALSSDSFFFHEITVKNEKHGMGRLTDFVEIMIPVFEKDAYIKYWNMIDKDFLPWGHGYDYMAKALCEYKRMGIIDSEAVKHTRPIKSGTSEAEKAMIEFLEKYSDIYERSEYKVYGALY